MFKSDILSPLNLWQYYVIDVKSLVKEFRDAWEGHRTFECTPKATTIGATLKQYANELEEKALKNPLTYLKYSKTMDLNASIKFMQQLCENLGLCQFEDQVNAFQSLLDDINLKFYIEWDQDLHAIVSGVTNRARFLRLEANGPKLGPITEE